MFARLLRLLLLAAIAGYVPLSPRAMADSAATASACCALEDTAAMCPDCPSSSAAPRPCCLVPGVTAWILPATPALVVRPVRAHVYSINVAPLFPRHDPPPLPPPERA